MFRGSCRSARLHSLVGFSVCAWLCMPLVAVAFSSCPHAVGQYFQQLFCLVINMVWTFILYRCKNRRLKLGVQSSCSGATWSPGMGWRERPDAVWRPWCLKAYTPALLWLGPASDKQGWHLLTCPLIHITEMYTKLKAYICTVECLRTLLFTTFTSSCFICISSSQGLRCCCELKLRCTQGEKQKKLASCL